MTKSEMAQLLSLAAAYDKRTVGETDVEAWHQSIAFLGYDDAACAVVEYYCEETRPIMPADIRKRVRSAQNDRAMREQPLPALPSGGRAADIKKMIAEAKARYEVVDDDHRVLWSGRKDGLRSLVLADPVASQRLCEPPLSFSSPDRFTGFVPPALWSGGRNQSLQRAALVDIVRDVVDAKGAAA